MTQLEFMNKIKNEAYKNLLKQTIDNNPNFSWQQKEYYKSLVDKAAQSTDMLKELMKMMGLMQ